MSKQKKFYLLLLSTFLGLFCLNLRSNVVVARSSFTMGILENDKPYSYKNDQNCQGFSIELAHQLEEVTDTKINFKAYSSQEKMRTALKKGQIDFILGDKANFSKSYQSTKAFLYPKNILFTRHDSKTKKLDKMLHKKVGLLKSAQQQALLKELGLKPVVFADPTKLLEALEKTQISAGILSDYSYHALLKAEPTLAKAPTTATKAEENAVLHRISDPNVLALSLSFITHNHPKINETLTEGINELRSTEKIAELSQKYFTKDLTLN